MQGRTAITARKTRILAGCRAAEVPWQDLLASLEPVVLKGLVAEETSSTSEINYAYHFDARLHARYLRTFRLNEA